MKVLIGGAIASLLLLLPLNASAQAPRVKKDLVYATRSSARFLPPTVESLLGALPENARELAKLASPVMHVDKNDPPLLLFHGDQDPQMAINQSHELEGAYEKLGLDVFFDVVHGARHGDGDGEAMFFSPARVERAVAFLRRTIGQPAK